MKVNNPHIAFLLACLTYLGSLYYTPIVYTCPISNNEQISANTNSEKVSIIKNDIAPNAGSNAVKQPNLNFYCIGPTIFAFKFNEFTFSQFNAQYNTYLILALIFIKLRHTIFPQHTFW